MTEAVAKLVTTKPDAELAADLKRRLAEAHGPLLVVLDECKDAGFEVVAQTGLGPFGKHVIRECFLIKKF